MGKRPEGALMPSMKDIHNLADKIRRAFNPDRIILFGSYAYGQPRVDSDVDLLVIMPFEGRQLRQSLAILNHANPNFPTDILVRRPDETEARYAQGDPLIREAMDRGMVLYERGH